jgi:hypothetical protein
MSTSPKTPIPPVEDGDAIVILRALKNHTVLSEPSLRSLVVNQFEADDCFDPILDHVVKQQWVERFDDSMRLTESGETWLEKNVGSLTVEDEDSKSADSPTKPYDVAKLKMEPKHLSVFQALRKIEKGEINLSPDFQRAFVWDKVRQSRLIESLLIRIPLPAFYLDATDQVKWNVVDGLQRLTTLFRYCREQDFALSGLQFLTDYNGHKFDDLPPQYKVLIEDDTQLLFYNLMPGTPLEAKFTIFSRVNTGGMQLTAQEIRHALSQGAVTTLLGKLAKSDAFRTATEGSVESLRMSDRELVLRALAFMHLGIEAYKQFNELDAFLLHAMSKLNPLPASQLEALGEEFLDCQRKVKAVFGKYAFRKFSAPGSRRGPLNKALFEVWTVGVRKYERSLLESKKTQIIASFIALLEHPSEAFPRSISASTGSYSAVSTRFFEIEALLERVFI